ncbi:MAG: DMT family transporter [Paracoccaceae bacterium]
MELWVLIAIGAAFLQNIRSALQKHLKGQLSNSGTTFSRFVFAVPLVVLFLAALVSSGNNLPAPNLRFTSFMALGGVAQIIATALLVYLFGLRNFAVGTTFSKTETIQAALFGVIILSDTISMAALFALGISLAGVVLISTPNGMRGGGSSRASLIGMASGAAFAVSGVSYRAASLALPSGDFLIRATFTLASVLVFQTIIMAAWLRWREVGQITKVLASWRISAIVGLAGGLASLGWFSAMTLENAAYVKAVGQVELLFTFAVSTLIFRERSSGREITGITLVSLGILLLLLWR